LVGALIAIGVSLAAPRRRNAELKTFSLAALTHLKSGANKETDTMQATTSLSISFRVRKNLFYVNHY